jgi:hypothetical protein
LSVVWLLQRLVQLFQFLGELRPETRENVELLLALIARFPRSLFALCRQFTKSLRLVGHRRCLSVADPQAISSHADRV